jgi:hypothetical protein
MAYRESRRLCRTCGRVTAHWQPRLDMRPPSHSDSSPFSVTGLVRAIRRKISVPWRCLDCDHPWENSVFRKRRNS